MELSDEARIELAKEALVSTVSKICETGSTLSAVLVVTDGVGLMATPFRLTKNEAFCLLVAACTALEPEDIKTPPGDIH